MSERTKNWLGISLIIAAIAFALSVTSLAGSFSRGSGPARTFTVSSEGEVVAVPDIAEFTYSVITEGGEDLAALQAENSRKSNAINEYLKGQGVDEKDIRTTAYNISPRYQYFQCPVGATVCPPPEIVGYTINYSARVKVRDLGKAGELLSGAVSAGANSTSNLTFSIDDLEVVKKVARDEAIQAAKEKAKNTARSAGFRLGRIVSVNESFYPIYPVYREALGFGGEAFDAAVPAPSIEPGSEEVKVNVTITYEIR